MFRLIGGFIDLMLFGVMYLFNKKKYDKEVEERHKAIYNH